MLEKLKASQRDVVHGAQCVCCALIWARQWLETTDLLVEAGDAPKQSCLLSGFSQAAYRRP